jgi:hypothetical protein
MHGPVHQVFISGDNPARIMARTYVRENATKA